MSIAGEKYVSFTTFTKNGDRKSSPVWIADVDGEVGFTTGSGSWKLKRLGNDPRCELQPSNGRGVVAEGAIVVTGRGREATPEEFERVRAAIKSKYGFVTALVKIPGMIMRLFGKEQAMGDTAILVTLD